MPFCGRRAAILIAWIVAWAAMGWLAPKEYTETASGQRVLQRPSRVGHHLLTFSAAVVLACGVITVLLFQDPGPPAEKFGRMLLPIMVCFIGLGGVVFRMVTLRPRRVSGLTECMTLKGVGYDDT